MIAAALRLAIALVAAVPYIVIPTDGAPGFCALITGVPTARWCHVPEFERYGPDGPSGRIIRGVIFCPMRERAWCVEHERCHLEDPKAACGH